MERRDGIRLFRIRREQEDNCTFGTIQDLYRPDLKRIDEMTDMFYDLLGDVISVDDGYEDFYGDDE